MRSLSITAENLKNQQEAVKQESGCVSRIRLTTTAIVEMWPPVAFGNFQSSHSLIGSFEDLNAAGVDDVAKFFKTYYAPNNAVLVIAGDFGTLRRRRWFPITSATFRRSRSPPVLDMTEPVRARERATCPGSACRVPALLMGWPAPKRHTQEWYALGMLDAVLTGGRAPAWRWTL